ncbi:MAG: histidine kinase [Bacteroidales bacterium]|nr:histidine kinase [Bacteroidales bacterium]
MNKIIVFIALLLYSNVEIDISAQQYIYQHFTTADGLPSSEVYHVFQDSKGYIWFATDNGVSRYNGYEFENFDVNDGLPENAISEIYEDFEKRIWFIGITAKLAYWQKGKIIEYKYNNQLSNLLFENPVSLKNGFYVDSIDNIYISVKGSGVISISSEGNAVRIGKDETTEISQFIYAIKPSINIPGIINYEDNRFENVRYIKKNETKKIRLSLQNHIYPQHLFTCFISDSTFIFCANNYMHIIESINVKRSYRVGNSIVWLKKTKEKEIWICPVNEGALCYGIENDKIVLKNQLLKGKTVTSVMWDQAGSYWFSTLDEGVFYLESFNFVVYNEDNGLLYNNINCLEIQDSIVWIGYNQNYISKIINNNFSHISLQQGFSTGVKRLFFDHRSDQIIAATSGFLYFIKDDHVKLFKNNYPQLAKRDFKTFTATDLILDSKGGYWIAGGYGFFHYKNNLIDFDSRFSNNFRLRVNTIYLDKDENLWLGSRDGLRIFKNRTLKQLGKDHPLLNSRILDIQKINSLFILASKGKGILFFDKDTVRQINKPDGINSNTITCLEVDGDTIWAGSLNGLNKITLLDKNIESLKVEITKVSELSSFEINQIVSLGSKLYLATNKGLVIYTRNNTSKIESINFFIKKVIVDGKNLLKKDTFRLNYNENNISFSFEALRYRMGKAIEYRYMLQGLESEWNYTISREARYYRIPPGKYTFIAMVKNLEGYWNEKPVSIKFEIFPSVWQTYQFKILLFLFLSSILSFLYKISILSIREKASLKKNMQTYMMQALVGQMNPHFIFNTLNSINKYILTNEKRDASIYLTKFSKLIRKVLENSRNEYISLSEEISALELYLEIESLRLKNKFQYSIDCTEDINIYNTKIPSLIIQPFIENAIWHGIMPSTKYGFVKIKFSIYENSLIIEVVDNGIGRTNSLKNFNPILENKKSLGSKITNSRLSILSQILKKDAKINYSDISNDKEQMGTKVTITLPLILENKKNQKIENII